MKTLYWICKRPCSPSGSVCYWKKEDGRLYQMDLGYNDHIWESRHSNERCRETVQITEEEYILEHL